MAAKISFRPKASRYPTPRPTSAETKPMASASTTTEPSTCLREAPIVRRVANSRVRWATVIESVLKMTKAPTKSAMPAKPSRKYRM